MSASSSHLPPLGAWLRLAPGRTVPVAVAILGLGLLVQGTLWIQLKYGNGPTSQAGRNARNGESQEAPGPVPSLLIEPRLEAPDIRSPWQELLERSRHAAARGETEEAIRLLEEAETQVPLQPAPLAEIAVQLEKCLAPARAIKLWEKVHQFGSSAGVYYSAADAKLSLIQAKAAESGESDANASKAGPVRFGKVTARELPQSTPAKRLFVLSVPIQKLADVDLQVKDVSVQVLFYDQVSGRFLERTNASRSWKWISAPVDWRNEAVETLEIEYRQGPNHSRTEERRYFGYVASIYFKDKLLDTRADPPRLGQQYPPSRILGRDPAP